jgi:putative membrane-bound dehydrogenase-like protein
LVIDFRRHSSGDRQLVVCRPIAAQVFAKDSWQGAIFDYAEVSQAKIMKAKLLTLTLLLSSLTGLQAQNEKPLRVFLRGGVKTHGPGQHDHPRFLGDWTKLLSERGAQVTGAMAFPAAQQLENTDVVVIYAADGMKIAGEQRAEFEKFLRRGGGLVVIHDGVVSGDQNAWAKKVQGGAWIWENRRTKWYEGEVGLYFMEPEHPITRGISNFDWKDEIYFDLDMAPDARVLATSFQSVFVIAPQLWTYEKTWEEGSEPYRAFVSLPGHEYTSFQTPHYRTILLRGIAWAGKRQNVDFLCTKEDLASLKYPEGGPTAPEKAVQKLVPHPEFSISLVAAEPLMEKPISLDWDHKGRLWIAETPEYPNGRRINRNDNMVALWREKDPAAYQQEKENRPARDRISYLEDTNGDGVMDKKTVFYEGLELVTSLVFHKDGVIVTQAPDILWLRDTDGDGKADKVEKLLTGFGTTDTHAVINNLRWGMDGWVYGAVGYSGGDPKSGDGKISFGRHGSAIYRFKPDGSAFEVLASTACNTWGFDFGWDGELFYTTPTCGDHALHVVMPEKVLARGSLPGVGARLGIQDHNRVFPAVHHTRPAYVQIDVVGGFTAAAGCCIYNGGAWPAKYDGTHLVSETTVSLVHQDFLKPSGVTYVAGKEPGREENEFLAGTDLWFRPIHQRVGPDGALYILDFYNQAAIHNDTRGPKHGAGNAAVRPDRDHHFGRIWRVQHKQAAKLPVANLNSNEPADLIKALENPNSWVRMTAHRLLNERAQSPSSLLAKFFGTTESPAARIHALWLLHSRGELTAEQVVAAVQDKNAAIRKNAFRTIAESTTANASDGRLNAAIAGLKDSDPRAKLQALIALGSFPVNDTIARSVVEAYPTLADKWSQSAAVGVAAKEPLTFVEASFTAYESPLWLQSTRPAGKAAELDSVRDFIAQAARQIGQKQDAELAARLIVLLASKRVNSLKQSALESLATALKPDVAPAWSSELQSAFKSLLKADDGVAGATLPLVARWDKNAALSADLKPRINQLAAQLEDTRLPDQQRGQIAVNLLGVRQLDPAIVPAVAKILGSSSSTTLQKLIIEALGNTPEPAAGAQIVAAYPKLTVDLLEPAFTQIVKRADSSMALLDAVKEQKINLPSLGPASIHRLRTHSDKAVADRAIAIVDEIRGPQLKEKNALIAKFLPAVERSGNVENGKKLYTQNCANCHKFKSEGRDLAPDLTGMGAHGAADLLVHILDPNRLVEPNYVSVSIETKDDQAFDGIVARENASTIMLRNANGDFEIRQDNVKTRRSAGLSVMPEGMEALGEEGLRDLIGYLCADENRFRILDLGTAFTANSTRGIYANQDAPNESLRFTKFGLTKVDNVPFEVVHPSRSANGNNLIVLKGGSGFSKRLPRRVEFKAGLRASKLHFLGGVGGWAYPWGGAQYENIPVAKVTLHYANGQSEELILKNGQEFADYNGRAEVPGSKEAIGLVRYGQVRWFTKPVGRSDLIERISIESFDNAIAPTFVAITAELSEEARAAKTN